MRKLFLIFLLITLPLLAEISYKEWSDFDFNNLVEFQFDRILLGAIYPSLSVVIYSQTPRGARRIEREREYLCDIIRIFTAKESALAGFSVQRYQDDLLVVLGDLFPEGEVAEVKARFILPSER